MIEGSPYSNLLKLMKVQGYNKDVKIAMGQVISPSPLTIQVGSLEFTAADNDFFLTQTAQKASLTTNDIVIVLIDGNDYFVLDKVVANN